MPHKRSKSVLLALALFWSAWLLLSQKAMAQQLASRPAPSPAAATKEQTVYVPFDKLDEVFEKEGRGVFLPYREFLEMWNKLKLPEEIKKHEPPVDGVLAAAHYSGKVNGDVAVINAKLDLEALKEGWSTLSLGGGDWNIADLKSTANLNRKDDGYEVVFPDKGKYDLQMTVFGKIQHEAGRSILSLSFPRTAVSQFELVVPDKGLDFTIAPACAFTANEQPDGTTKLAVYFGASEKVQISWQKRAGETALTPLLFSETAGDVKLSAGAMRTSFDVQFRILRAGVNAFEIDVPPGQQVLSVDGENLRDWNIEQSGTSEKLKVNLHTPARERYALRVNLETSVQSLPAKIAVPSLEVEHAERQNGVLTISTDAELVAELADLQGLTQESAPAENDRTVVGQYRFLRLPYSGTISVAEAKPVVEVNSKTLLTVEPELQRLDASLHYDVKKAGIFSAQILLPEGFTQADANGADVESAVVQENGGRYLLNVTFSTRKSGVFDFHVTADTSRKNPADPVTVPLLSPQGVARNEAAVGLAIHTSLKANITDNGEMRPVDVRELGDLPIKNPDATPLTLAFRYHGEPKPAQVAFELRKPRVSVQVLASSEFHEAMIRDQWTLRYKIEYTGVDEFQFSVPKSIANDIQIDGQTIKERTQSDERNVKGDLTGNSIWTVTLQDKKLGDYDLTVNYETPQTGLKQGTAAEVSLQELKPLNVFRETGQIAVIKDGNLECTNTRTKGLEVIDPAELDESLQRNGVFLAYKYAAHPISLNISVLKNLYLDVPQSLVTYAVMTSVVAENKAETTEVVYWVRNNSQQFLSIQLPPNGKMLSDAFVNGEPQQPSRRADKDEMLIRLPAAQLPNAFPVRFIYEVPSPSPDRGFWMLGAVGIEPPVLKGTEVIQTQWTLYLPGGYRYVKFGGLMREKAGRWGWQTFRQLVDPFIPNIGPAADVQRQLTNDEPPALHQGQAAGFDFQVPKEGYSVVLRRLDAPAKVEVHYRSNAYASFVEAVAFLLAFLYGVKLLAASRKAKWNYAVLAGGGSLVVAGAIAQRAAGMWTAIYLGVLCDVIVWTVAAILRRKRVYKESGGGDRPQPPVQPVAPVPADH